MKPRTTVLLFLAIGSIGGAWIIRGGYNSHNHTNAERHLRRGDQLQKIGNIHGAIEEMKLAIADDPKYFEAREGLAYYYQADRHLSDAIAVLEKGAEVSAADSDEYHYLLCQLYEEEKDYTNALAQIRLCLQDAPQNAADMRMLGMLLERTKQYAEAEKCWQEYVRLHPQDVSGLRGLSRVSRLRAREQTAPSNNRRSPMR